MKSLEFEKRKTEASTINLKKKQTLYTYLPNISPY